MSIVSCTSCFMSPSYVLVLASNGQRWKDRSAWPEMPITSRLVETLKNMLVLKVLPFSKKKN